MLMLCLTSFTSPPPLIVVHSSLDVCHTFSQLLLYLTYVHLYILATDLVPVANGLGLRVSSTALL